MTSFNPLRIYFFSQCYLRFCAVDYSLDDLNDKFIHLANNSIAKNSDAFKTSQIKGNMWHSDDFIEHLKQETGTEDTWYKNIQPRMKKIVAWSLMCVQDMVQNRPRSCELYGYDFMIDDQYNPMLIEVNSSPAMDYSTKVTKSLVKHVLPDSIKVLLDREKWCNKKLIKRPGKKARSKNNTGMWDLIYDAPCSVTRSNTSLAADLQVSGKAMIVPKKKKKRGAPTLGAIPPRKTTTVGNSGSGGSGSSSHSNKMEINGSSPNRSNNKDSVGYTGAEVKNYYSDSSNDDPLASCVDLY